MASMSRAELLVPMKGRISAFFVAHSAANSSARSTISCFSSSSSGVMSTPAVYRS